APPDERLKQAGTWTARRFPQARKRAPFWPYTMDRQSATASEAVLSTCIVSETEQAGFLRNRPAGTVKIASLSRRRRRWKAVCGSGHGQGVPWDARSAG